MNRIVLIGNGFDLAHGLPTRYEDFINWYWDQWVEWFRDTHSEISKDTLCTFKREKSFTWSSFYNQIFSPIQKLYGKDIIDKIIHKEYGVWIGYSFSPFFGSIIKSIETKGWVDIENEYYNQLTKCTIQGSLNQKELEELNSQLSYITDLLVKYLNQISKKMPTTIEAISDIIYSPIKLEDVSIEGRHFVDEYSKDCLSKSESVLRAKIQQYGLNQDNCFDDIRQLQDIFEIKGVIIGYPQLFMLPDDVLLLNFNYTDIADSYKRATCGRTIHIHGKLNKPDSIIFGYGDELDEKYKQLKALNENECLKNIKSIKYLESDNYRNVLRFMESAPFQVVILGHSCGNSDRTLLNTIFEHKNCISIKPYYYQKPNGTDNYLDIVQNISRNFTDMKLMRDRVVNKTFCEPLAQAK